MSCSQGISRTQQGVPLQKKQQPKKPSLFKGTTSDNLYKVMKNHSEISRSPSYTQKHFQSSDCRFP